MTARALLLTLWIGLSALSSAAEATILKVLPHLLDAKGRSALAPSLFERDAYQAELRAKPELVSALRFAVQFKTSIKEPVVLRLEIRGSKMIPGQTRVFETDVLPRKFFSTWGELHLNKKTRDEIGSVLAWRVTLRKDNLELAEQQSFLW